MANPEMAPQESENEKEQTPEEILDALEIAFEQQSPAELTVLEPSGELRTNTVLIEGLEGGMLFVSADKASPVIQIELGRVKKVGQ